MSISDRLDQLEREAVEANEHLLLAALRAVLEACDRIDASLIPHGDFETGQKSVTGTMRAIVTAAFAEDT